VASESNVNPLTNSGNTTSSSNPPESHSLAAADLFREANEARRQGDFELCIRRYRELEERFAASPEAQASHVSLGKVLQSSGDVTGAVREFSIYLLHPGALEEESLVGLAEALGQLGRNAQAQNTWRRLLDRYPNSVYAARARQCLAEPK
jgi:TolA-binding protein